MATYAVNLASGATDEKGIFRLLGKLLTNSGVIESTALTVSAQGTPTMSLNISGSAASDNAVFITSNGDTYHGWNTAQTTVTIAANSSGNTMVDSVVAYINLGAGIATANNPGALVFTSVRGASANTAPTAAAIQAAVGASNPYLELAHITVGNGVSSINSGNITDVRIQAWINQPLNDASVTLAKIASQAWTAYTPSWTAVSANPSLGNGTIKGRYMKIGRLVHVQLYVLFGSTTTFGTGIWQFSLPSVTSTSVYDSSGSEVYAVWGSAFGSDTGVAGYQGIVKPIVTSSVIYAATFFPKSSSPQQSDWGTASNPFTWGSGDYITLNFIYEATS